MQASEVHRSWGRKIRERREAMGLTQTKLAAILDVHQPAVSAWENGSTPPRDDMKFKLAGALGELFPFPAIVPPFPTPAEAVA
jgi:transcriptional regulator with XRE-family HTH domain